MGNARPRARVVARSTSSVSGVDIITLELEYWKSIHGEFMTHRVFSRNASSSRAIPVKRLVDEAIERRSGPLVWASEQKGMQGGTSLDESDSKVADAEWGIAAGNAVRSARNLYDVGVHKSICNRLIEPFTAIRVVVTSTDWLNFFGLRLHSDAQPEMRMLAEEMWHAVKEGPEARVLKPGEWHLPYADDEKTIEEVSEYVDRFLTEAPTYEATRDTLIKVSVARCARVSYKSFETGMRSSVEEDLKVYEKLVGSSPVHASPAEHQATPDELFEENVVSMSGAFAPYVVKSWMNVKEHGNFHGWRQYRQTLSGQACAPLPPGYDALELGITR